MVLVISTVLIEAIRAQAREAGANECCGLLLGENNQASAILPAANVAAQPHHLFEIDPAVLIGAYRAARAGGPVVIGHYHSHPLGNPTPSPTDAAMAEVNGAIWLIVGGDGAIRAWRATAGGALHGRFEPIEITASPHTDLAPTSPDRH